MNDTDQTRAYRFKSQRECAMCGASPAHSRVLGMRLSTRTGLRPRAASGVAISVLRCRGCGLVYPQPLPVPLSIGQHYDVDATKYWTRDQLRYDPSSYFRREIETAKRLLDFRAGMSALDVGAGIGKCVISLQRGGFEASGIEPSPSFRNYAVQQMGIAPTKILERSVEDAEFGEEFDFITFGAVLEHLTEPGEMLRKALSWVRAGGLIHCEVPSASWLVSRMINAFYRAQGTSLVTNLSPMHVPYHLYEFELGSFLAFSRSQPCELAHHEYYVCSIPHVPAFLHPMLRQVMGKTDTGMQLAVWLRKCRPASA